MKRIRRHKYLLSVFFLMYTVVHAVPSPNGDDSTKNNKIQIPKATDSQNDNTPGSNKDTSKDLTSHHHIAGELFGHADSSVRKHTTTNSPKQEKEPPSVGVADSSKKNVDTDASKSVDTSGHSVVGGKFFHHLSGAINDKNSLTPNKNGPTQNNEKESEADGAKNNEDKGISKSGQNNDINHTNVHSTIIHHVLTHAAKDQKSDSTETPKLDLDKFLIEMHDSIKNWTLNSAIEKCTPPAIKQFPRPLMSMETRRHGGLILHIIVAVYMFIGLAIVCDEYFVASLDRICEELKMSPDVAGATFMAAGSSAPELAIVIIGVFLAKDDIGISGVIGSAVFNIMFVIACCGLCSTAVVYLNWWPLVRDCFFYALSIIVMLIVIYDERITWVESVVMLATYLVYCVVLHFNTPLEKYAHALRNKAPTEQSSLVSYKTLDDEGKVPNYGMEWSPEKQQQGIAEDSLKNFGMEWSPERHQQGFANQLSGPALNQATIEASPPAATPAAAAPKPSQQEYYKPKAYDPSTQVDPLVKPEGGLYAQAVWIILYPIHFFCRKTTPDCRSEKYKNWYPLTFFVSMVWISFYSYFMVWMITIIGFTLGIPDTVMGLTFVAAGVSVPDALSSIAVVKEGYGDMAVSNAVGSNVFDILICLGLPWFLNTAIVKPGSTVKVTSKGLTYSTLSLLSTVVFLLVATHLNGWKLDRRYGFILLIWYLIFISLASMYELNIFANWNPPQCALSW